MIVWSFVALINLKVEDSNDRFNSKILGDQFSLPIAHGEGNYRASDEVLANWRPIIRCLLALLPNPNGSINDIAGIRNNAGNVYGMMPHPERAVEDHHPCLDGLPVLKAFLQPLLHSSSVELSA